MGLLERFDFQAAGTELRVLAAGNQAGAFEHFEVPGNGRQADREWFGQFVDGRLAAGEPGEDRAAGGIGERVKGVVEFNVVWRHRYLSSRLINIMVKYYIGAGGVSSPSGLIRGIVRMVPLNVTPSAVEGSLHCANPAKRLRPEMPRLRSA